MNSQTKSAPDPRDRQVGGNHYLESGIQPWEAIHGWYTKEMYEGFIAGNVVKYLCRYRRKGGLADLQKAHHYLGELIRFTESSGATKQVGA